MCGDMAGISNFAAFAFAQAFVFSFGRFRIPLCLQRAPAEKRTGS